MSAVKIDWSDVVDYVAPYIVKISTPVASGSGFLLSSQSKTNICVIATAAHVVDHAHYWEEPIRIDHPYSGKSLLVRQHQRALFVDPARDTGALVIERGDIPFPEVPLELLPADKYLRVGNEIGWLGFPVIASQMCFFSGRISAWREDHKSYLVDGVAINGVSGGPAFCWFDGPAPMILGVISAYISNRQSLGTLPGLAVATDVSHFHEVLPEFASIDEAREKQSVPTAPPTAPVESDSPSSPTRG